MLSSAYVRTRGNQCSEALSSAYVRESASMRLVWMLALTARAARGLARTSATTSAPRPNVVFVGAGSFGSAMALVVDTQKKWNPCRDR